MADPKSSPEQATPPKPSDSSKITSPGPNPDPKGAAPSVKSSGLSSQLVKGIPNVTKARKIHLIFPSIADNVGYKILHTSYSTMQVEGQKLGEDTYKLMRDDSYFNILVPLDCDVCLKLAHMPATNNPDAEPLVTYQCDFCSNPAASTPTIASPIYFQLMEEVTILEPEEKKP